MPERGFMRRARDGRSAFLSRFPPASLAIFSLGLALRLYTVNARSVSYDEAFSMAACRMPAGEMLRLLVADFVHPPLHYFVLCGWLDLTGFGVLQARLLSVIFGTLAIVVLYRLADYLFDRRTALLAALLLAISQLEILYSQDARMYAQFLFLFLCCCYLFIRALEARSFRLWSGFVAVSVPLVYTHYFAVLALGAMALFAFLYRRRFSVPVSWWIGGAAVILLSYVPWLTSGVVQAIAGSSKTFSGRNAWWAVDGYTFFAAVNFFNSGKPAGVLNSSPLWTFPVGALLFTLPALLGYFRSTERRERQNFWLSAMLWVLPLLGAIVGGLMNLQYNHRYVAFCAAPYYILVGRGISTIRRDAVRAALIVLLVGYTANSLRANYFLPEREDFRGAAAYIRLHAQPGDCGVFLPRFTAPLQWTIEQEDPNVFRALDAAGFPESGQACSRIWTVSFANQGIRLVQERARAERRRLEASHTLVEEKHYLWVEVALFMRKQP